MVNFVAKYSIYVITLLFMIICSFLTDKFLTASNLVNILRQVTVYAVLAFGQAILLISGNLDLCAGSTCCLTGILALKAYLSTGSMVVAILVGMVMGLVPSPALLLRSSTCHRLSPRSACRWLSAAFATL